jgi:hypothetical protein
MHTNSIYPFLGKPKRPAIGRALFARGIFCARKKFFAAARFVTATR